MVPYIHTKTDDYFKDHEVTFVATFSRHQMITPFFNALVDMEMPREKIHLLIHNNTDKVVLKDKLEKIIKILQEDLKPPFASIVLHTSNREGGRTLLGQDNDIFDYSKLKPIWEMWKDLHDLIKTDVFFLIEDDTIAPPHAFYKLMEGLFSLEKAGFVIGISTGRCPYEWQPTRLGVHYMDMKDNKIVKRISLSPDCVGIHEIDGAGVYCFAAYKKAWLSGFEGMDEYVYKLPFFGMDNALTYNMKQYGWKLYADFDVWVDHMQMSGEKMFAFNKKQAVIMADIWLPEFEAYAQGIKLKQEVYDKVVKKLK